MDHIEIKSANTHNLKNISLNIPRNKLVVITGPSGSGKSSLAFDTIFQEGQRRYLESLTASGAPFMQQLPPVDVEYIRGLSPTPSLDQKSTINNRRSTVGTITEIYDYLRILFAKCAIAHSPESGKAIVARSEEEIFEEVNYQCHGKKTILLYPGIHQQKGAHHEVITKAESLGFSSFRINGKFYNIDDSFKLDKNAFNSIDIVVDKIIPDKDSAEKSLRLKQGIHTAIKYGSGNITLILIEEKKELNFSTKYYCPLAKKSYPTPHPTMYSFNSPKGQCPDCLGLGFIDTLDVDKIIDAPSLSLDEQLYLHQYLESDEYLKNKLQILLKKYKYTFETPVKEMSSSFYDILVHGKPGIFLGILPYFTSLSSDVSFENLGHLDNFFTPVVCSTCQGNRLLPYPLAFKYREKSIDNLVRLSIQGLHDFFESKDHQHSFGILFEAEKKLTVEILSRCKFLLNVGLSYLSLNRLANSLSGGELQRIRLASQLGSQLSGVVYILDEPSIGLHQRDNLKLIQTLKNLRDLGNSILVVEHDEETIRCADHVIDIGPESGEHGGIVLFNGSSQELLHSNSVTAEFLNHQKTIAIPHNRRKSESFLTLKNCHNHNLKNVILEFPLNTFVAITGVSGSGKSTLIHQELVSEVKNYLRGKKTPRLSFSNFSIDEINAIDQKPIGRSPKSIPLSYCGIFDNIRQLFANTMSAKMENFSASNFSFNVKSGRCTQCEGNGSLKFDMPYLNDSYITCPSCQGKRYNDQVLQIKYRGLNIDDVLNLTIEQAAEFFQNHRKIFYTLKIMCDIGLGYLRLGQSSTTLSGGEAQRIKLAKSLSKMKKGKVLYVLDEPTTGLHFKDITLLLSAINKLVDQGNTVLVIEHNLDLIKCADYIVDLGPEGGDAGGNIVAAGTPEDIAKTEHSLTGNFLKKVLSLNKRSTMNNN